MRTDMCIECTSKTDWNIETGCKKTGHLQLWDNNTDSLIKNSFAINKIIDKVNGYLCVDR